MILIGTSVATLLALKAIDANAEFFISPTDVYNGKFKQDQRYRIAGMVKKGSVDTQTDGVTREFVITDCVHDVNVQYKGILPDLFREGQAIIALGMVKTSHTNPVLVANQVLAKHDENYVPSEAADTMMQAQANQCDNTEGAISF